MTTENINLSGSIKETIAQLESREINIHLYSCFHFQSLESSFTLLQNNIQRDGPNIQCKTSSSMMKHLEDWNTLTSSPHIILTLTHLGWTVFVDCPEILQSSVCWDLFFAGESGQHQLECRAQNLAQLGTGLLSQVFWGEMRMQNVIIILFNSPLKHLTNFTTILPSLFTSILSVRSSIVSG